MVDQCLKVTILSVSGGQVLYTAREKKFQDAKLPLVDQALELDSAKRAAIKEADELRANRNALSKKIGQLMGQAKKDPSK